MVYSSIPKTTYHIVYCKSQLTLNHCHRRELPSCRRVQQKTSWKECFGQAGIQRRRSQMTPLDACCPPQQNWMHQACSEGNNGKKYLRWGKQGLILRATLQIQNRKHGWRCNLRQNKIKTRKGYVYTKKLHHVMFTWHTNILWRTVWYKKQYQAACAKIFSPQYEVQSPRGRECWHCRQFHFHNKTDRQTDRLRDKTESYKAIIVHCSVAQHYLNSRFNLKQVEHCWDIDQVLFHVTVDWSQEIERHGKLEEKTIDHDQVTYSHATCMPKKDTNRTQSFSKLLYVNTKGASSEVALAEFLNSTTHRNREQIDRISQFYYPQKQITIETSCSTYYETQMKGLPKNKCHITAKTLRMYIRRAMARKIYCNDGHVNISSHQPQSLCPPGT